MLKRLCKIEILKNFILGGLEFTVNSFSDGKCFCTHLDGTRWEFPENITVQWI